MKTLEAPDTSGKFDTDFTFIYYFFILKDFKVQIIISYK